MAPIFLILCLIAALVAGTTVISYLLRRRAFLPAFFLAAAFIAIWVLLYSAFYNAPQMTSSEARKRVVAFASAVSADSILPIYVAIFGYGIIGIVITMIAGPKGALVVTLFFILVIPQILTFYRNYLVFSAVIALGVLVAGSITALVAVMRGRPRKRPIGSDSVSHLLYYLSVLCLMGAGSFCFDIVLFTETLAVGFVAACGGSLGIMIETNQFSGQ